MATIVTHRFPQVRLADPADAPPERSVAHAGWLARFYGEPRDTDGLGVAVAGEWLEGYDAAGRSAIESGLFLEWATIEHLFD